MSVLRKYLQGDKGRFDFRISDGLGNYLKPDWDDPDLKVEFFDAGGSLRFTATKTSSPSIASDEDSCGKYIYIAGIALDTFSQGVAAAKIYCKLNGAPAFPYPTVLEAFEVAVGIGTEPLYTLVTRVRNELPSNEPEQLTDDLIRQYIYDASRRVDAFLCGYYSIPFPGIEQYPQTPSLIERLTRKLAVADCLVFLGIANQVELRTTIGVEAVSELTRLRKGELRLPGNNPPVSVYQGDIYKDDDPTSLSE